MMNLSCPTNVKEYANAIELIKKLNKTIFTRRDYEDACTYSYKVVGFNSLVDAGLLEVVDVDHFAKKYFQADRWDNKKWLSSGDCEAIDELIHNLSNYDISEAIERAIYDKVNSIDCKRFHYRLKYNSVGDYIRGEMPWVVRALEGGVF